MIKKTLFLSFTLFAISYSLFASGVSANDEQIICPQPYGGGVVCGIKTHAPIETGTGDNLALVGSAFIASSFIFLTLSKRLKPSHV